MCVPSIAPTTRGVLILFYVLNFLIAIDNSILPLGNLKQLPKIFGYRQLYLLREISKNSFLSLLTLLSLLTVITSLHQHKTKNGNRKKNVTKKKVSKFKRLVIGSCVENIFLKEFISNCFFH